MSMARPGTGATRGVLWRELGLVLYAVQFLTRIPVPAWVGHSATRLDRSTRYFPLVGALVGTIAGALYWLASQWLPAQAAAVIAIGAGVLVTGAFHEDGLADSCDGLGGGVDRERALEIMRDSRIGTYGTVALVLALLLRVVALAALAPLAGLLALITAHAAGRTLVVAVIRFCRYARTEGLGKPVSTGITRSEWLFATGSGVALVLASGIAGLFALLAAASVAGILLWLMLRKLGGYTGDGLGAVEQCGETAALVLLAGWTR